MATMLVPAMSSVAIVPAVIKTAQRELTGLR